MPYKNWATTDTLNAADLNAMTADAGTVNITTSESTTSTGYVDLATVGPSVTVSLVAGQGCLVIMSAAISLTSSEGTGWRGWFSYAVSGASTQVATDTQSGYSNNLQLVMVTYVGWFVATATGSHTFKMQYKTSNATNAASFTDRRLTVKKF